MLKEPSPGHDGLREALSGPEMTAFLASGRSLVVGTVSPDGEPVVTRGWGLSIRPDDLTARVILPADDQRARALLGPGGAIAITSVNVLTLTCMQFKGRSLGITPCTDDDRALAARFADLFFDSLAEADIVPRALLERILPVDFVTCVASIEALYDQTPGPIAGAVVVGGNE